MIPPRTEKELLDSATSIAGHTLGELARLHAIAVPQNLKRAKGWVGELLEVALGATGGSRPVPDFESIGVELKSVPLNSQHRPQESTFVSTAPLINTVGLQWSTSPVKAKLDRVLWVPIEAAHEIPVASRRIGRPILWSPSPEDSAILQADWEEHIDRIALGNLDELGAQLGTYLQIRPKALNRQERTLAIGSDGEQISVLPRGFYLRTCFTRKILGV